MFLNGCSQILESVILSDVTQSVKTLNNQENFDINIKSLTFKNAQKANSDSYPRQIMLTGLSDKANVYDENDFLKPNIPLSSPNNDYTLGIGDKLSFLILNEFSKNFSNFPPQKDETDYLIGIGDELTFIQMSDEGKTTQSAPNQIVSTSGIVGTNGNVLLLGLGSIKAKGKSLNFIQSDIRNILIRNGFSSNFQIEITGFNSKKAFVTYNDTFGTGKKIENVISISNLPITLKEVILLNGLETTERETLMVTLERNGKKYSMPAAQIFDESSKPVIIENKDHIGLIKTSSNNSSIKAVVGSKGNILIPGIGNIKAENRTLAAIHADITKILLKEGVIPNFQLEIIDYKSKKFFLVEKGLPSQIIPLTDKKLTLKEAIFGTGNIILRENERENEFTIVNLIRAGSNYQITTQELLNGLGSRVLIQDGDTVELKSFKYKLGQVFALSSGGNAQMIPIDPSKRETLADILFTPKGALNNLLAKRSEVYLLRGRSPSTAYHLDAQNVSRILVAAQTELRPNDIIYVAERPIISFSRTLAEILPLRILLRDIQEDNIP